MIHQNPKQSSRITRHQPGEPGDVRSHHLVGQEHVGPPARATISASAIVAHLCL